MREIDEPIAGEESLYRSISSSDVSRGHVVECAVDTQGTSVHREKYVGSPEVAKTLHGENTGVASVRPMDFAGVRVFDGRYEYFAVDAPEMADESHAEIRWRRTDEPDRREHRRVKNKKAKLALRSTLAKLFKIEIPPTTAGT